MTVAPEFDLNAPDNGVPEYEYDPGQAKVAEDKESNPVADQSTVEQVKLIVPTTDDPSLPTLTFRVWVLGIASCSILSFVDMFFSYQTNPLFVTSLTIQILSLPVGKLMAQVLPTRRFFIHVPGTKLMWSFTFNPGPFNIKEHVLITLFANGAGYNGGGTAYAVGIVNIIKAFYKRDIQYAPAIMLVLATQLLGYGWAGLLRRFLVDPEQMWWPSNLAQVSLFHALHEKEKKRGLSRIKFFLVSMTAAFVYYTLPGYLIPSLASMSLLCFIWPRSVTAQQLGSGRQGLGIGAFSLDWATMSSFLGSPLIVPWYAIANVAAGYLIYAYILVPILYWNDVFHAKNFPLTSTKLYTIDGNLLDFQKILTPNFELDEVAYEKQGKAHLTLLFAMTYFFSFASLSAAFSHVGLFHGKEIWEKLHIAYKDRTMDVHTRLMKVYRPAPEWWFQVVLLISLTLGIVASVFYKDQLQMPWWGVIMAAALSATLTLPLGILQALTSTSPGLNVLSEYLMGYLKPGQPITNVTFKTYSTISVSHTLSFLADLKLGHYMKVPPRAVFVVQIFATILGAVLNLSVGWWLLATVKDICSPNVPSSVWTCPGDQIFFNASLIWGLLGPRKIFGPDGVYNHLNWGFLIGLLLPIPVWLAHKKWPKKEWIRLWMMPVFLGGMGGLGAPIGAVNYTNWILTGTFFSFYVYRYHKSWWQRYNYVLSASLDAGTAFFSILAFFSLNSGLILINWWGQGTSAGSDHCPVASCATNPAIHVNPICP